MIITGSTRAAELAAEGEENNPFVAHFNRVPLGVIEATASLPDGAPENAATGTTFEYWRPDITATTAFYELTLLGSPDTLTCVAIAAHNLSEFGGSVQVQKSTDGQVTWTDATVVHTPTDNTPIVFRLAESGTPAQDWRLRFSNLTAGDLLRVGVVFMGKDIVFPTRFYKGFSPVLGPTEVQLQSNVSVGGNYLGSSVVRKGSTIQASFQHLSSVFGRGRLMGFANAFNNGVPFFFGWRPEKYPEDVYYCWRNGDVIRPANSDTLDLMTAQFSAQVFEA